MKFKDSYDGTQGTNENNNNTGHSKRSPLTTFFMLLCLAGLTAFVVHMYLKINQLEGNSSNGIRKKIAVAPAPAEPSDNASSGNISDSGTPLTQLDPADVVTGTEFNVLDERLGKVEKKVGNIEEKVTDIETQNKDVGVLVSQFKTLEKTLMEAKEAIAKEPDSAKKAFENITTTPPETDVSTETDKPAGTPEKAVESPKVENRKKSTRKARASVRSSARKRKKAPLRGVNYWSITKTTPASLRQPARTARTYSASDTSARLASGKTLAQMGRQYGMTEAEVSRLNRGVPTASSRTSEYGTTTSQRVSETSAGSSKCPRNLTMTKGLDTPPPSLNRVGRRLDALHGLSEKERIRYNKLAPGLGIYSDWPQLGEEDK